MTKKRIIKKKITNTQSLISGGKFEGAEFGGNVFGKNELTQNIIAEDEKICPICQEIVGANNSSNCQCEKEDNHCEYCQTDQTNEQQNCSCQKESKEIVKKEIKNTQTGEEVGDEQQTDNIQTLISGGEFDKAKFTGSAFTENVLIQSIGKEESEKTCSACELAVEECQCEKNDQCEYCQNNSIDKKICCCEKLVQVKQSTSSENQQSLLVTQLKENQILTQEGTNQIKNYLKAKKEFLNARQQTIKELQECCNKLETFINERYAVFLEVGNTISNVGGSIASTATLGVPKAIGEAVKSISNFSKIKISKKSDKEFQLFLVNEDKLNELNQVYNSLVNVLNIEESKLFNAKYEVFDILTGEGVWQGRPLNLERMETAIKSLYKNLDELNKEREQETRELKDRFGIENVSLSLVSEVKVQFQSLQIQQPEQSKDLQEQIQAKKDELEQLINSTKEKLKSQSKFSDNKRKERNEKLEMFFKNFPTNQDEFIKCLESIKENLSKKLTQEEIDNLCQARRELTKLQTELENQQNQQQTLQVQPTHND